MEKEAWWAYSPWGHKESVQRVHWSDLAFTPFWWSLSFHRVTPDVHSLQISFSKPSQRASRRTPWPSPAARDPESLYFLPSPSSYPVSFALLAKMHLHPQRCRLLLSCDINAGPWCFCLKCSASFFPWRVLVQMPPSVCTPPLLPCEHQQPHV